MNFKVGQFVLIYYWDHISGTEEKPPEPLKCKTSGWVCRINNTKLKSIMIAHDYAYYQDDTEKLIFPFSTILMGDVIKVIKLPDE